MVIHEAKSKNLPVALDSFIFDLYLNFFFFFFEEKQKLG